MADERGAEIIFLAPGYNELYQVAIAQELIEDNEESGEMTVEWSVRFLENNLNLQQEQALQESSDETVEQDRHRGLHRGGLSHAQSAIRMKLDRIDRRKNVEQVLRSSIRPDFTTLCFQYHQKFVHEFRKAFYVRRLENKQFNLLLLGLGAGAVPGHIYEQLESCACSATDTELRTYAAELDPGMVSLALDVFSLRRWSSEQRLTVFTEDFRAALEVQHRCMSLLSQIDLCMFLPVCRIYPSERWLW
eukprot:gb/GECG01015077.1/.p1 GENE.gb/GECG01015077.1/~~gb/GECG01015077.1/.p1  ORF type:complete len:247 (+),score=30.95 gb/GECG01015077.1/:1-741(+)